MIANHEPDTPIHTLVDVFNEDGTPLKRNRRMSRDEITQILDSQVRVVSYDIVDSGENWALSLDSTQYDLNEHTSIFVQKA